MSDPDYRVEYDGSRYIVLRHGDALGAFSNADDAFNAKRSFSGRPHPETWQKVPPAIRLIKQTLYG